MGRKCGGVVSNTTSTPLAITFLYASKPTYCLSTGTSTLCSIPSIDLRLFKLDCSRSSNTSPIETSLTLLSEARACEAAPVPLPPHPINPTRIVSSPAAKTDGAKPKELTAAALADATAAVLMKILLEAASIFSLAIPKLLKKN